ncbi:MAG: hypothetical protein AAGI48_11765 [Verrucomicrobiota bacterium]
MNFRQFAYGLTFSFGIAWLAVVVIPFFKLRNPAPVSFQEGIDEQEGIYHPKRRGRVVNGYQVYAENGCYQCHTQVVRNTDAGNDLGRKDWGGLQTDPETGRDTRRESNAFDYSGLDFAPIGVTRLGPDLMNVGIRVHERIRAEMSKGRGEDEDGLTFGEVDGVSREWFYLHLYDPRLFPELSWSKCPPHRFLFEERKILGSRSTDALEVETEPGLEIVPSDKARALVSYLISLKHDDPVPAAMDYSDKSEEDKEG